MFSQFLSLGRVRCFFLKNVAVRLKSGEGAGQQAIKANFVTLEIFLFKNIYCLNMLIQFSSKTR
jgi:hypothetical protein